MGKRKSKTKVIKIKASGLSTMFDCFACHEDSCITIKIDKSSIGTLRCRSCNFSAKYPCNPLDRPIDVYSMWVDDIHEANNGGEIFIDHDFQENVVEPTKKERVTHYSKDEASVKGDVSEDESDGDHLDEFDRDLVVSDSDEDEGDYSRSKSKKKSSKSGKKGGSIFVDDIANNMSDDEFVSSDEERSSKRSRKDKKDKKDKKDRKSDKKSKKSRPNTYLNSDDDDEDSKEAQEYVQLPPPVTIPAQQQEPTNLSSPQNAQVENNSKQDSKAEVKQEKFNAYEDDDDDDEAL